MNINPSKEPRKTAHFHHEINCYAPDELIGPWETLPYEMKMGLITGDLRMPCKGTGVITPFCGMCAFVHVNAYELNAVDETPI